MPGYRYRYRALRPVRAACCLVPTGCCLAWAALLTLVGVGLALMVLSHL